MVLSDSAVTNEKTLKEIWQSCLVVDGLIPSILTPVGARLHLLPERGRAGSKKDGMPTHTTHTLEVDQPHGAALITRFTGNLCSS